MKNNKILIACLLFKNLTGSEVYYYELAKTLSEMGYDVTVGAYSVGDGEIAKLCKPYGIKIKELTQLTDKELKATNSIICSHYPVVEYIVQKVTVCNSNANIVSIIHGEYLNLEKPYISDRIKWYIGIRPSIVEILKNEYGINNCSHIWNPFDFERFNTKEKKEFDEEKENTILYCGTVDFIRKDSYYDMASKCQEKGWKLQIIGANSSNYLDDLMCKFSCVEYHEPVTDIENYVKEADATCGIFVGRTTIEGWLCGIPGFVYTLNKDWAIEKCEFMEVPEDISVFDNENVTNDILDCVEE